MIKRARLLGLSFAVMAMFLLSASAAAPGIKTHLEHAKTALLKKDLKAAALHLRNASQDLAKAAESSPGAAREGLLASGHELKTLAGDVEKGSVTETRRLDAAAGRAFHALAHERFVTATEAWAKKDVKTTGTALKAAADYLEDGAAVVDRDAKSATKEAASASRGIATKLVQGVGWTSEEVGRGMDSFGKELAEFGRRAGAKTSR